MARNVLLAVNLDHRDLQLQDPQLPAPQAAALTPEALADTAPEDRAVYLRITCRRFNTALGRRKGTPYSLSSLLYPAHPPHLSQLRPSEGWTSFRDAHLAASDEATATRMDPADQRAYVRGLEARLREAHCWHARSPLPERGQGGSPAPNTDQAKKSKTGQWTRKRALQQGAAPRPGPVSNHAAPPHAEPPEAHKQHHPYQRPSPQPYHSTLTQQPSQQQPPTHVHAIPGSPYTQSQGTRHHQQHHRAPVPPNPTPGCPNTTATPTSYIPITPRHDQAPTAMQPTRHTSLHHSITYTTTTSPYHRTRQRWGTTHNQRALNTTTTRSSTTYRPNYTGWQHTDHCTPPLTRAERRTHTSNTRPQ